jgi:integrase
VGSNPTPRTNTAHPNSGAAVEYALWLKKEGYRESTILRYAKLVRTLSNHTDIYDAESVKTEIARQTWSEGTKELACDAYALLAKSKGFSFERPRYQRVEKLPFIPLETEIDALICGTGPKTSVTLQLLKETAARIGEAWNLKWTDIDFERSIVTLTPEKGSHPRQFKISSKLCSALSVLVKKNNKVLGSGNLEKFRRNYEKQRRNIATKLGNPRLSQITLHTFRHWKATYEYNQTHDILYVMRFLGHKSIQNTLRYTQLVDWKSEDFVCKTAKSIEEASSLIEAGFDYVTEVDSVKLFRKRK